MQDLYEITSDENSINIELSDGSNLRLNLTEAKILIKKLTIEAANVKLRLEPKLTEPYDQIYEDLRKTL
jgi:hypothetical protein